MHQRIIFIFLFVGLFFIGCSQSKTPAAGLGPVPKAPPELAKGEALYNTHCARCHGEGARGTDHGPSFLSKIYEPSHHGDAAFQLAPQRGVRSHHWNFGDMPRIDVSPEEVDQIIPYVRWLQKQVGIS
jgi:mono/diheme cytochrome c family protein